MNGPEPETDREFLIQIYANLKRLNEKFDEFQHACVVKHDHLEKSLSETDIRLNILEEKYHEMKGVYLFILLIFMSIGAIYTILNIFKQ